MHSRTQPIFFWALGMNWLLLILLFLSRTLIFVNLFYVYYCVGPGKLSSFFGMGSILFLLVNWIMTPRKPIRSKIGVIVGIGYLIHGIGQMIFHGMYWYAFSNEIRCCERYTTSMFELFNFLILSSGIIILIYTFVEMGKVIRSGFKNLPYEGGWG